MEELKKKSSRMRSLKSDGAKLVEAQEKTLEAAKAAKAADARAAAAKAAADARMAATKVAADARAAAPGDKSAPEDKAGGPVSKRKRVGTKSNAEVLAECMEISQPADK